MIFDKFIREDDFEKDKLLKVTYEGMYDELKKIGFEYALMEFNSIQIVATHRIKLDLIPRFLYSQHPKNVYDPKKLIQIWKAKIETKDQRHKELMMSSIDEFYDINKDLSEKYSVLSDHVKRIKKSFTKYGK
jgi:hypothetical protein